MTSEERRSAILRGFGADAGSVAELLNYNTNHFEVPAGGCSYPLPDEPFVEAWTDYAAHSTDGRVFDSLKGRLPQLNFPIREGISHLDEYKAATRRGEPFRDMPAATGLALRQPQRLSLVIHPTPAGRIPLLIAPDRADFVSLVRALTLRNEPGPVPASMGACIVAGYNNWDRVARYRSAWSANNTGSDWAAEFQRLVPRKDLYQDRLIILSREFYSSVPADAVGLSEHEWREKSFIIRREHECTHYFTRRVFSSMRNHWLDELIADYSGVVAAAGRFRADWLLRFAGLEDFPNYRPGGRLENYRGDPSLSDNAFQLLQVLAHAAALSLQRLWDGRGDALRDSSYHPYVVTALSLFTLEELAGPDSHEAIWEKIESLLNRTARSA